MRLQLISLLAGTMLNIPLLAEPTGEREWRSTAGTTITADALAIKEGTVLLKTSDGRELKVPMAKLVEDDRQFLTQHFDVEVTTTKPGEPVSSGVKLVEDGLPHPTGAAAGPIDAGGDSHYFVYVPKSLRDGRKAPLMFYTGASGGSQRSITRYAEAAELNGWIIAASVESRNGPGHPDQNHEHSKRCVEHLLKSLPIDEERVYFSGNSGGGAMSFFNARRIKSLGNMPFIGYSPDKKYDKKQYCFGIGGTNDYNRYLTANATSQFGKRGFHRLGVGGHSNGPDWIGVEGIVWLNGRFLGDNRKDPNLDAERLDYEAALLTWIEELSEDTPYRAHYWCQFLLEDYAIEGPNAAAVKTALDELAKDPLNVRYTEGIAAINEFSKKYYAPEGESSGSKGGHTSSKIQKAAEKLAAEYAGVPEIEEIAKRLGDPTVKI